jgi:hypothetical protein
LDSGILILDLSRMENTSVDYKFKDTIILGEGNPNPQRNAIVYSEFDARAPIMHAYPGSIDGHMPDPMP